MCRDEDHLALFIELLGRMPKRISGTGKYAKDYFTRYGELRHIKKMRFWPLDKVLTEKYHLPEDEVSLSATQAVASCLSFLEIDVKLRQAACLHLQQ